MEEPLPADAPPLPEDNESDDVAGESDGGKGTITRRTIYIMDD